ncbi:MAG: DUF2490 domain-containing protein [Cryomorphaceae bacterium]|nr:DUF2490 domain-containing protein [Flavobacteriales bacterium]
MKTFVLILVFGASALYCTSQNLEPSFEDTETNFWLSSYNKFRLTDKLYWAAELHYRRVSEADESVPFVANMAQIYNRHGLNYVFSPNFNVTVGGVLRLNFSPDPESAEFEPVTVEPRIWHQYMFVSPWPRFILYNRIRIEHRWNRSNRLDADYTYRNRWRYMFYMKIPLNKKQMVPGALYFSPSVELIMQTGKTVVGSFVEDLRLYGNLGYILSPRATFSLGMMYTTGQNINDPTLYGQRWILRASAYISLDFRKEAKKVPSIKLLD